VLKRQKILTEFLLHTTAPCLFQIVLKSGLHLSTSPSFAQKDLPPVDMIVGDIRRQIAAEWLKIVPSVMVTMESLYVTIVTLSNGAAISDPV